MERNTRKFKNKEIKTSNWSEIDVNCNKSCKKIRGEIYG